MALTFFWRCEGETLSGTHDYSAGDTTATASGAPSISATAAKVGSNGVLNENASDFYQFDSANIVTIDQGSFGFWLNQQTIMASGLALGLVLSESPYATTDNVIFARTGATGDISLTIRKTGSANLILLASAGMSAGNFYFITAGWHLSQDKRKISVYNSAGTLVANNTDTTTDCSGYIPTAMDTIEIGQRSSSTSVIYVDNVFIGNSYDDADIFYTKRDITSYTEYPTGHPTRSRVRGIPGMNDIRSRYGRGW